MNKIKSSKGIVAATCFSALCAAIALGVTGCTDNDFGGFNIGGNGYITVKNYDYANRYSVGDFTFGKDVTAVDISWALGSVELKQTEGDTFSVTETSGALEDKYKMHWLIENSTLYIKFWEAGLTGKVKAEDKALTVQIPASLVKLEVDTASASVTADKINANDLELDTASGSVTVGTATAVTECNIDTASGSVNIDLLEATGGCKVDTASGGIEIKTLNASGECDLESASGKIKMDNATVAGLLDINTASGSITVGDLTASTLSVDVASGSIGLGLRSLNSGKIESASGSVDVTLLGGLGATVVFDGASGKLNGNKDGTYTFGDGACRLRIETASGDVSVKSE